MPVASKAPHWQPVRSTNKMAFIAARSDTRGRWQPKGWALRAGKNCSSSCQSSSEMRQPSSLMIKPIKNLLTQNYFRGAGQLWEIYLPR